MATQVQFRGGTTVEHSTFTGAAREITIDTDKDTVVVHDGATAGGYPLAKEDGATLINVDINSGTIDGTTIGATTPSTVSATDLTATGTTTLAGADTSADITFGDNVKATFGIGSDLQIYHDGADSRIVEAGTGNLKIQSDANTSITDAAGTTISARFRPTTHVSLYYNSSEKLATTSTGITVTGTVTADGLALSDNILRDVDNNSMFISGGNAASTGANIGLYGSTSGNPNDILLRRNNVKFAAFDGATGDISFYEDTGTTAKFFWDASAESLTLGGSSEPAVAAGELNLVGPSTTNSTAQASLSFYDGGSNDLASIQSYRGASFSDGELAFEVTQGGAAPVEAMRIDSSGRVGIGTSSPAGALDISGGDVILNQSKDLKWMNTARDTTYGAIEGLAAGTLFKFGGSEAMRIDSSGRVGIGTSSPAQKLHIENASSSAYAQVTSGTSSVAGVLLGDTLNNSIGRVSYDNANNSLQLWTSSAERMRIDSSGKVGIGASSPSEILHVATAGGASVINLQRTNTNTSGSVGTVSFAAVDNHAVAAIAAIGDGNDEGAHLTFRTTSAASATNWFSSTTERMRIQSDGAVHIGFQSYASLGTVNTGSRWSSDGTSNALARGSNGSILGFYSGSGSAGNIAVSGASTSYNTSSDYRLKENVETLSGAITRVKTLKPKRFSWIEDGLDSPNIDGFIAHEVQDVIPEAISGTKDAMRDEEYEVTAALGEVYTPAASATYDDDGNELTAATDEVIHSTGVAEPETLADGQIWRQTTPAVMGTRSVPDYQGIDQSKLVPLLTAALQEAIAKIEDLETRVAALEGL